MSAYLSVMSNGREARQMPLGDGEVRIGRAAANQLSIPDLSLSREHAVVWPSGGGFFIRDLSSRNGTYLGELALDGERELRDGDIVQLGETTIVFHANRSAGVRIGDLTPLSDGTVAIPAAELLQRSFGSGDPHEGRLIDALTRASRMLIVRSGLSEVFEQVLDVTLESVGAQQGVVMLLEGEPPELVPKATRLEGGDVELTFSSTIAKAVIEQRTSLITTDARVDPRFDGAQSISLHGIRSAMCAPLLHDDKVTGLLYVDRRYTSQQFSETDLAISTILANLTAAKIENERLLEVAMSKRKLEEELALAADIQRRLLPSAEPSVPGWELAAMSIPSRSVGGDLYDYVSNREGELGLVVADVSGKGMSAALLMASLQANLRAFASSFDDLAKVMGCVNDALVRSTGPSKFATVIYVELDVDRGVARYVNAGHNPGLVVRASGEVESLGIGGVIVGAFPVIPPYEVGTFEVHRGDMVVLYSDGVTEAEAEDGDMLGEKRLEETLLELRDETAAGVRDGLYEAIHAFTGGSPPSDDTTILVARRL